jgi:hypothetical protein
MVVALHPALFDEIGPRLLRAELGQLEGLAPVRE